MNIYLVIITTILVLTQIIRIVQNTINLYRNNKVFEAQLKQIEDVTQEDLETQKEAYRLIVKHFKTEKGGEGVMYNHYAKIAGLHCANHPELRIGQLMSNFEQWLKDEYGIDIFYLENVRFVPLLEEYLKGGEER